MSDSRAVAANDRLPWLSDDKPARASRAARQPDLWPLVVLLAVAVVALIAYQLGTNSPPSSETATTEPERAVATVPLPDAEIPIMPQPNTGTPSSAESEALAARPTKSLETPETRTASNARRVHHGRVVTRSSPPKAQRRSTARTTAANSGAQADRQLTYWPAYTSAGASGRMVRIGTFDSRHKAKQGWWGLIKFYPGMKQLPTVVVPVQSMRDGKTYYRLQMGTTSQAHSEVLCQRMRIVGVSCVVVGMKE